MVIIGVSAYYHDSAVALLRDGEIIAAAQEERFTRIKQDPSFQHNALTYCLEEADVTLSEVDFLVFYDKPFLKFERLLENYLATAPLGFNSFRLAMPVWLREKLFLKNLLMKELRSRSQHEKWQERILFSEHHLSHAASAFFPSPFEEAVVLTMDGVGEWTTTSLSVGRGNDLKIYKEIHYPHSLGLLYSAFTYYTGFKINSGEYKVMGLAPYGEPRYASLIKDHLIDIKQDGSFRLNMEYFGYCSGLTMTNQKFHQLFGGPPRKPEDQLTQREMDLATSIQSVTEEIMLLLVRSAVKDTGVRDVCLAGGVALNCVGNGKIIRDGAVRKLWVQPAAGDAGGALGASMAIWHMHLGNSRTPRVPDSMQGAYLGPSYSQEEIEQRLARIGAVFEVFEDAQLVDICAREIANGKAVGWFQGRMEFGPRALGSRSILGDARSASMQSILNLKVKYRESFRPFAPSILRENTAEWFEIDEDSPYMLLVADVVESRRMPITEEQRNLFGIARLNRPRSEIPAVTHVDYSARIQTVHRETNPRYHALLTKFKELTGCPLVVNTSFNVRGEPIVCTPEDAFSCFMGTEIEVLAAGNCILYKEQQDSGLKQNYLDKFELD